MEMIIENWWKVIILLGCGVLTVWGVMLAIVRFLKSAKESGVDEVTAGPVKVDFEDNGK